MDPSLLLLIAVAVIGVVWIFFSGRRRRRQQEEVKQTMVPGARVMTSFGLFGTIVSVDDVANEAELEIAPGTVVTVHRQTLSKVVTPSGESTDGAPRSVEEAMAIANREEAEREAAAKGEPVAAEPELSVDHAEPVGEPEYGERIETSVAPAEDAEKDAEAPEAEKKPAPRRRTTPRKTTEN